MKLVVWCPRDEKCDVLHSVCVIHSEVHGTINYMAVMGSVSAGNNLPLQSRSNESSKYLHRHPYKAKHYRTTSFMVFREINDLS